MMRFPSLLADADLAVRKIESGMAVKKFVDTVAIVIEQVDLRSEQLRRGYLKASK